MSSQRQICTVYKVFGDCATGAKKCTENHKGKHGKQTFLIALITKMSKDGKIVSIHGKQTPYYISHGSWHRNGGQEGDLVALQESSVTADVGYYCARIVAVYGKTELLPGIRTTPVIEKSAFTLDTPGTQHYEDALSMADCPHDDNCKIIGIHIAVANSDFSIDQLPYYKRAKNHNVKTGNQPYFIIDKWNFAISIYLHSKCESVSEPQISIVKITNNCTIGDSTSQCKSNADLSKLFQCFTRLANEISFDRNAAHLCRIPNSWRKDTFMVGQAISIFNSAVVNYLHQELPTNPAFFITGASQGVSYSTTQTIFIPEGVFRDANDHDDNIPMLIARVNQSLKSRSDSTNQLSPRYERDVKGCSELQHGTDVKFTAPMRKIQSFINQQVLFGLLINPESCLYSKEEQLGILGIRFRTPKLYQSVINGINDDSFRLDYISRKHMYENVCDIKCEELNDECKITNGKISMEFRNISCIEYSNFQVISFSKHAYDNFFTEFCGDQDLDKCKHNLLAMNKTKQEQERTYRKVSNTNTRLILQTGTTLHLQISNEDSYEENNLGLRLLRMGKNCHLCLLHMNHPELAFMSDRKDIRSLDLEKKITVLKERKLTDEKLNTVRLTDVNITWSDEYYSGGSFTRNEKEITTGDVLCICKEEITTGDALCIKDIDGSNIKYVWNSHAVVTKLTMEDVFFAVCTLSQTHGAPKEDNNYCVEIICTEKK